MRILQLIDSLSSGGAERMAVNISNTLAGEGHQVFLCATRKGGKLEKFIDSRVSLFKLNKRRSFDICALLILIRQIRRNKIQLIHAHSSSIIWGVLIRLFVPGIKLIWHDHHGKRKEKMKMNRFIIFFSFWINGVICVNEELKEWSKKKLKVNKENITFINNFPLLEVPVKEYNTHDSPVKIVCLANLREPKDHINLLRAIHLIKEKNPYISMNVYLAGNYSNDRYFLDIKDTIFNLGLFHEVEILGSVDNTAELIGNVDIGVLSSISEGLPVSLLEYGLAGLPVVVTDVGQCAEVVDFGKAGLLVPPADSELLANALLDLISNPQKRSVLGNRLKERVENEYGSRKFMNEYHKLIKRVGVQ